MLHLSLTQAYSPICVIFFFFSPPIFFYFSYGIAEKCFIIWCEWTIPLEDDKELLVWVSKEDFGVAFAA